MTGFAGALEELEVGQSVVLRDGWHRGVTIVRGRGEWAVVDLENCGVSLHARLRLVRSATDGDETGLNHACIGCDLDAGLWLIPGGGEIDREDCEVIWDSEAAE